MTIIQCLECGAGVKTFPHLDEEKDSEDENRIVKHYDVKIECRICDWSTYRPETRKVEK